MQKMLSNVMTHMRSNRAIRISVTTQQAMAATTIQRFVRERKWNRDQMLWAESALARTAQTDSTVRNLSFALRFAPQRTRLLQREAALAATTTAAATATAAAVQALYPLYRSTSRGSSL